MRRRPSIFGVALWFVLALGLAAPAAARSKGKRGSRKAPPVAVAPAANPETKKPAELLVDDRAINKQMQWEDKVMGSNSAKKAELAKIARAAAITRAAEQAAAEKGAAAPPPPPAASAPKPSKMAVALPALPDEGATRKDDHGGKAREVSPALSTTAAAASVPAPRPADDKFIDKILASDGKKRVASRSSDGELEQLLTKESDKPGAKRKGKRKDMVDDLLENAGKNTPPPAIAKSGAEANAEALEGLPTPPPLQHVAVKKAAPVKRDDGIIHVVQGANYAIPMSTTARPAPVASAAPAAKAEPRAEPTTTKGAAWTDPFADKAPSRRVAAAAPAPTPRVESAPAAAAPPPRAVRPTPSSSEDWKDPFAEPDSARSKRPPAPVPAKVETKPAKADPPPAKPAAPGWKDPFADNGSLGSARKRAVALSTTTLDAADPEPSEPRWRAGSRHASRPAAVDGHARWSVIKKR